MKVKAFVLVETAPSKPNAVTAVLKQLEGVKTADMVTGPYDVIAIVEGETLKDVGDLVTGKVQPILRASPEQWCAWQCRAVR